MFRRCNDLSESRSRPYKASTTLQFIPHSTAICQYLKKQPINRNRNKQSYKHPGEQQRQGLKIWLRENTQIHSVFWSNIYKFYSRLVCKKRAMGLI